MKPSLANLRKKAAALAERIPLGRLEPQALSFWQQRSEIARSDDCSLASGEKTRSTKAALMTSGTSGENVSCDLTRWAVALSGGADSVALLLLLWAHYPHYQNDLLGLHYNHRLRGAAADEDEAFCRELCEKLGVELVVGRRADGVELRSEAAAREARFAFFSEEMAHVEAPVLWLGHQQNDVAETLLMRLVRGSGTGGLAAPRPVQTIASSDLQPERVHLRPLLTLSRAEIEAALRDCGVSWREDATNAGSEFFRNRIRHDVLPTLITAVTPRTREGHDSAEPISARAGRDALAGMALSRQLIDEDDAALDAWADTVANAVIRGGCIDLRELNGAARRTPAERGEAAKAMAPPFYLPRAVKRRVLYRWLREHAGAPSLSRQAFEALLSAIESGKSTRQSLGKTGFALIRKRILKFEPNTR